MTPAVLMPDDEPTHPPVLNYHRTAAPAARRLGLALGVGAIPFLVLAGVVVFDATEGDPPSFDEFKAYHFWIGFAIALVVVWTIASAVLFWRRRRWFILIAVIWCAWICWAGYWLLREVRAHPAGQFYLTQW